MPSDLMPEAANVDFGKGYIFSFPVAVKPYLQLSRLDLFPVGMMHGVWPGAWAVTMAAFTAHTPPLWLAWLLFKFFGGTILVHCAACTVNDILDLEFDRQVERTKDRPLVAGTASLTGAWLFYFMQIGICVALLWPTSSFVFRLGLIGLIPLPAGYPLMKRVTYWPQIWLGLAMNWPLVMGWVTVMEDVDWTLVVFSYLGNVCWTITYDTIYSLQDRADDEKAGVKTTTLIFGRSVKPILAMFASIFILSLVFSGLWNHQGPVFFVVSVGGATAHFVWQLTSLNIDNPTDCCNKHLSNADLGSIVWLGTALDYALHVY